MVMKLDIARLLIADWLSRRITLQSDNALQTNEGTEQSQNVKLAGGCIKKNKCECKVAGLETIEYEALNVNVLAPRLHRFPKIK